MTRIRVKNRNDEERCMNKNPIQYPLGLSQLCKSKLNITFKTVPPFSFSEEYRILVLRIPDWNFDNTWIPD